MSALMERDAATGIPIRPDVEARLINWGRWCNAGRAVGHCGSIEWRWVETWKQRYGWKDDAPTGKILDRIDSLDAEKVQAIMRHLPQTYRVILTMMYVRRETPKRIAIKAECREWQIDGLLFEIMETVDKCLTRLF